MQVLHEQEMEMLQEEYNVRVVGLRALKERDMRDGESKLQNLRQERILVLLEVPAAPRSSSSFFFCCCCHHRRLLLLLLLLLFVFASRPLLRTALSSQRTTTMTPLAGAAPG